MHEHRSTTAKAVAAIAAVGLIPFGLVAFGHLPASDASATLQPGTGAGQSLGWITIDTDATPGIGLFDSAGVSPVPVQSLSGDRTCTATPGTPALLGLRGSVGGDYTAGLASYASGSIGVKEKKSGTSCSQVNAATTETLELKLGAATGSALGAPALISAAFLDLELKQSAQILATATRGDTTVGHFELRSGTSALPIDPLVPPAQVSRCANGADSGPDSGVNDNCRWAISAGNDGISFDTLTLKAVQGSFSVEGGGDGVVATRAVPLVTDPPAPSIVWPQSNASVLELVDGYEGILGCGGSTPPESQNGDAPGVIVHRLNNVGDPSNTDCTEVPYSLSNGSKSAQFLKPLDTQTEAQFVWEVTWRLPYTATTSPLPQLTLDYETNGSLLVPLGWCPDADNLPVTSPWNGGYETDQVNPPVTIPPTPILLPDQDEYPNKQFACIISRQAEAVDGGVAGAADDYVLARDLVYVLGDATMRR